MNHLSIRFEKSILDGASWTTRLFQFWQAVSKVIHPVYGDVRNLGPHRWQGQTVDCPAGSKAVGWWWSGIPRSLGKAVVLGVNYQRLWPSFSIASEKEEGLAFASLRDWQSGEPHRRPSRDADGSEQRFLSLRMLLQFSVQSPVHVTCACRRGVAASSRLVLARDRAGRPTQALPPSPPVRTRSLTGLVPGRAGGPVVPEGNSDAQEDHPEKHNPQQSHWMCRPTRTYVPHHRAPSNWRGSREAQSPPQAPLDYHCQLPRHRLDGSRMSVITKCLKLLHIPSCSAFGNGLQDRGNITVMTFRTLMSSQNRFISVRIKSQNWGRRKHSALSEAKNPLLSWQNGILSKSTRIQNRIGLQQERVGLP